MSRSGDLIPRTPSRTFHVATPLGLRRSCRLCPHVRGANLTIPAWVRAQEASSISVLTIPNGRRRLFMLQAPPAARCVWLCLRVARSAHQCLHAAGPRATPSTPSDKPGRLSYLLCVNILVVPASLTVPFACRVEISETVLCARRVGSVCMCC